MIQLFKENYRAYKWVIIAGLLLQLIACVCSVGNHNPDEHWQLNEFAAYKLGFVPDAVMPWEHHQQARQVIQPFIIYCFAKVMLAFNCYNPFHLAFLLRLLSGMLAWVATLLIVFQSQKYFKSQQVYKWTVSMANLLWFMPYVHARFQGENWAGIFMAFGVFHVLQLTENKSKSHQYMITGILLGFAFNCRFQIGFALAALGLWLLTFRKCSIIDLMMMAIGFGLMIGLEAILDYWYYGVWVFMPYRYFYIQLIQGVSDTWGVFPWWYYFELFLTWMIPVISYVLLPMLLISTFLYPKHLFNWLIWAFVLGHNLNGYKEIRYLYPLIPYFIVFVMMLFNNDWWEALLSKLHPKVVQLLILILMIENYALLAFSTIRPANETIGIFQKVYQYHPQNVKLYCIGVNPYHYFGIEYNFYKPKNLEIVTFDSTSFSQEKFQTNTKVLLFNDAMNLSDKYKYLPVKNIYKTMPDGLKYLDFNGWLSRTKVWGIYERTSDLVPL